MEAPILVDELELTAPIVDITLPERADGPPYNGAYLLVRLQHLPLGYVELPADALDSASIARQVWDELSTAVNAHYQAIGAPAVDHLPLGGLPVVAALDDSSTDRPLISV